MILIIKQFQSQSREEQQEVRYVFAQSVNYKSNYQAVG